MTASRRTEADNYSVKMHENMRDNNDKQYKAKPFMQSNPRN